LQAWSQQMPSTQFPLAHWFAPPQGEPFPRRFRHTPAEHQSPAAQSASLAHPPRQAVAPQRYAPHAWVCAAGQCPAPSQEAARVATPFAQEGPRHCETGYAQAAPLMPLQAPPHPEPSEAQAGREPRGAPATAVHAPMLPGTLHAWHCPLQAWSQQTPSAQWPEAHWFAAPQLAPAPSNSVQTPAAQKFPAAQSESTEQLPRQAVEPQT
jgi:hypothetical protein